MEEMIASDEASNFCLAGLIDMSPLEVRLISRKSLTRTNCIDSSNLKVK
jgi:hypothetical protein